MAQGSISTTWSHCSPPLDFTLPLREMPGHIQGQREQQSSSDCLACRGQSVKSWLATEGLTLRSLVLSAWDPC